MRAVIAAIALGLTGLAWGQVATPAPGVLVQWSFDTDLGSWQSTDPNAALSITEDANVTRGAEHGGVLEYAYTPAVGVFAAAMTPVETGLTGGAGIRFWLKTSEYTVCLCAANEEDGSDYNAGFVSLPDRWQEVGLDFSEFTLGEDSQDENGRLDPGQIRGLGVLDMTAFLAQAALEQTFIVAPELGPRLLWLDDLQVVTESVPPRWEVTEINGKRAVRLDSFESGPLQWVVIAGKGVEVEYDQEFTAHGDFSLRVQYDLPPGKLVGMLTSPRGPDLTGMKTLRVWLMSEVDTTAIVALKEADGSDYNLTVEVPAGNQLAPLDFDLADFRLGDDSADENGRLDLEQATELTLGDISALVGNIGRLNTLWIDDVAFTE